jgi:hypothetical protein
MKINIIFSEENLPDKIPFYCMVCRTQLFKQNRGIIVVWFGEPYAPAQIPKGMGWVELRCHSCKTTWSFYYQ